jgi:hypothetical protein
MKNEEKLMLAIDECTGKGEPRFALCRGRIESRVRVSGEFQLRCVWHVGYVWQLRREWNKMSRVRCSLPKDVPSASIPANNRPCFAGIRTA